jgi:hypothetical protein
MGGLFPNKKEWKDIQKLNKIGVCVFSKIVKDINVFEIRADLCRSELCYLLKKYKIIRRTNDNTR